MRSFGDVINDIFDNSIDKDRTEFLLLELNKIYLRNIRNSKNLDIS